MKHILIFILLCFASELWAQYPNGANKLVLGRQTTGDGLIFRGDSIPSFTPTSNANAWFFLDTAAQILYTHIGGTWVSLADTITSGGTVTLSGEVVGESNATKLDTVDRVIFDPTNGGADSTYKLTYNANDFTLHFGMGLGNQVYQMGQELYYPPCINKTASTIYAGQPVMIDTSDIIQGDRLAVMPAFANGLPANYIVGVAAHDIAPNEEGLVTWFGYVREVDESDIAASGVTLDVGDILYLSATPGKYSDTEPAAPAINSTIALVVRKPNANNMTLLVRPWLNEKLGDLTDVDLSGIADGDALVWDSISGTWQTAPKQDPLTGTGLVKSTGGTISYVTDNSADWNAAYNDRITGAAFTGSTTKTLTLTQQDAGTVTASFTDLQGVTSVATGVGLSGGTITTTGTIIADTTVLVSKTFLTNQGYTSNVGTVTSVATGVGLTGGTITSSGTISADTTVLASKTWTETRGYLTSEVDGSVTNEGSLTVGAGTGTTSVINSNTSGSTGVTISASTGLSISESGNTITLTNSAPDQTVSLTGAGITSISGTYPSFTITSTEVDGSTSNELQNLTLSGQSLGITSGSGVTLPVVGISGGSGIGVTSSSGTFTITNNSPDQTVSISSGTGITVSGSYPNFTVTNASPDQTVSISGAGINSVSGSYPNFTITGTEVDGSTTNELQNLSLTGQTLGISSGSGVTLPVVGITAGTGISTTSASGDFIITNSAPEATTARNVNATGEGVFRDEVGNELQFKKLVAGSNITLTGADSTVTIAASGGGTGTVTSITAGTGLTGGTITTSGTIAADTSVLSTKYYAEKQTPIIAYSATEYGTATTLGGKRAEAKDTLTFYDTFSISVAFANDPWDDFNRNDIGFQVNTNEIASVARLADTASTLRALIPTGGGTVAANKVAFGAPSGDTLTSDNALHWDDSLKYLGINNTSPAERLQVGGNVRATTLQTNSFSTQILRIGNPAPAGSLGDNVVISNHQLPSATYSSAADGYGNVSVGSFALIGLTTGFQNFAFGRSSMFSNTSGYNNTAIGVNSAYSNTTGNDNLAIGTQSLYANTTGALNIAIGSDAVKSAVSSNFIVGIGSLSLANITGANNTAIGSFSGTYINSGSNNVTSANSIYIGYDTRASANGNTNEVVIGYDGRGNGSNTTTLGNTSTTGTFLAAGNLNLTGQAPTVMQTARQTTAGQAGNNLTIKVGGAASGATDAVGGDLILESGVSTGTGSSNIIFETAAAGISGTTDRTPTERMRINGNGNVGIGTNNPASAKFTLASGDYATMRVIASSTGEQSVINFYGSNNSTFHGGIIYNSANTEIKRAGNLPLSLWTNSLERMTIKGDGTIGIGTNAPKAKLHINGSISRNAPVQTNTDYTIADDANWIICIGTGTITLTLPTASNWTGREIMVKTTAAFTVVSHASNVVPLAGGSAGTAILSATAGKWATLVSDGTNWIIMQAN